MRKGLLQSVQASVPLSGGSGDMHKPSPERPDSNEDYEFALSNASSHIYPAFTSCLSAILRSNIVQLCSDWIRLDG